MSARKIAFSNQARRDLSDILLYTEEQWGIAKRSEYRRTINQGLAELRRFPEMGRSRSDLPSYLRVFLIGRHIVYYSADDTELRVYRVVHPRRELDSADIAELPD